MTWKKVSLLNKRNRINTNAQKLKKVQRVLTKTYQKGQVECQFNKIRNLVVDKQSRLACQTVKEVNRNKSVSKAKLKTSSLEKGLQKWKEHMKNELENPPEITDKASKN